MDEVKDKERRIYFGDMLMAIGAVLVTMYWNIMFLMCFIGLVLILIGVVVNMMGPPFGRLG